MQITELSDMIAMEGARFNKIFGRDLPACEFLNAYVNEEATILIAADHDLVIEGYDAVWSYSLDLYDWGSEAHTHTIVGNEFRSPQEALEAAQTVQRIYDEVGRYIAVLMDSGLVSDVR